MARMLYRASQLIGLLALTCLSVGGVGWAQDKQKRPITLAAMCQYKDFESCIRGECGAPITPTPVKPGQPYVPTAAENQQQACYKQHAEPCRVTANCPH